MRRKKIVFIVFTICLLLICTMSAFARLIPGVDYPFDEAAFYSADTPDYADSPSVFGIRYLTSHAMDVYDPKRHQESIKYGNDFRNMLEILKQITGLKELNTLPFGFGSLSQGKENIEDITDATMNLNSSKVIGNIQGKKIFRDGSISNFQPESLKKEQLEALAQAYAAIAEDAKKNLEDLEMRTAALDEAVERSANAQGYMQAVQARNEINALREAEEMRYNAILNDYLNLLYLEGLKEEDEENRRVANAPRFRVADPYNITETDKKLYPNVEREKSHFVDF
ncbi:hypothetical protein [Anaerovibrio sp.]|uniref:hypothetical protein n=1 Tax=Anaerovibrio sp. TaxID=1872532 RepID=UPI00388D322F